MGIHWAWRLIRPVRIRAVRDRIDVQSRFAVDVRTTDQRRQVRLVISDRGYTVFLALLPFLIGVLTLTVRGKTGFDMADPLSSAPNQQWSSMASVRSPSSLR